MKFSTAAYWRLKRQGGQISLKPLAALASALAGRPITVRWGQWQNRDMDIPKSLGHWDPINDEIVLHNSLGWSLDQRLTEIFLHELGHCLLPKRNLDRVAKEAQAEQFATMALERVGSGFVWWMIAGMQDEA